MELCLKDGYKMQLESVVKKIGKLSKNSSTSRSFELHFPTTCIPIKIVTEIFIYITFLKHIKVYQIASTARKSFLIPTDE